jgi:hypothetical protein
MTALYVLSYKPQREYFTLLRSVFKAVHIQFSEMSDSF